MLGLASILRSKQFQLEAGTSCRMDSAYTAGVATIVRIPRPIFSIACKAAAGKGHFQRGRLQVIGCGIGSRQTVSIANIYGGTRGAEGDQQALRTDILPQAALDELAGLPGGEPCLVVGDFNADTENLTVMQQVLASGWTDLGLLYDNSDTCFATSRSKGTRRDYVLANAAAMKCTVGFRVVRDAVLRTHRPLVITMQPNSHRRTTYTHQVRPKPLAPIVRELVQAKIKERMKALGDNYDSDRDRQSDSDESTISYMDEVQQEVGAEEGRSRV